MSEADTEAPVGPTLADPSPARRFRPLRWIVGAVATLLVILGLSLVVVDTDIGHRVVADQISRLKLANGLRFRVGRIDGSLYSDTRLVDLQVYDTEGLAFRAPAVTLDWRPFAWVQGRLDIRRLVIPRAALLKVPRTRRTGRRGPILPDLDIHIGDLTVGRLDIAGPVLGTPRIARLRGRADIVDQRALVAIDGVVEGSDRLHLKIDATPDRDRFDIDVAAQGIAGGLLARMVGNHGSVALDIGGEGSWTRWRGRAEGTIAGRRTIDLALAAEAGRYTLSGVLAPSPFLKGKLQRLTAPRVAVNGSATFADRRLDGALTLRSASLAIDTTGVVDLAANALRNVRIRARLLRPPALFPNMTGRDIELRAILDGAFGAFAMDYRLDAARFAFERTGFEDAHAAGRSRWSASPVRLPLRFRAARVTGIGDVAGGILRGLAADGVLLVTPTTLIGNNLAVRSDKLTGRVNLSLDLRTGRYEVGVNGALGRYLIPGLGVVDVTSTLQVVPGAGGKGTRIVGRGAAVMRRLDNAFFRSLAGGLPRITTDLERGADGILYFRRLVLTAPSIRLAGNGYRRRDGSFHFEGAGTQASYGPVTLVLDGKIDRPTLDLVFARPNAAMGLRDVRAHLDPTAQGYAFRAAGGSRLGPFSGNGAILLPRGGQASIAIAALDVAGTRATGTLAIVPGGFDGRLAVAGGGIGGAIAFRPQGGVQRIDASLDAKGARFEGTSLRSGHLDLVALLDPAGASIDATATGLGLRRGSLSVARFAGNAKLRGGEGQVRASIAGSRGRAFSIQTVTDIRADRYSVQAEGTLDRRPLKLLTPAVIAREKDGWRLSPTRLSFAGGEAQVFGLFTDAANRIEAGLTRMPLAILDIGYPGLGLGGTASGQVQFSQGPGVAPTGRVNLTVRGLNRAGLVLSSRPIDMGLAAVLTPDKLGVRAVMASGGQTIGRAQMMISPLGTGDLAGRIVDAPMTAQLRYNGSADTLWRLTGVELFDLSGPVAIGADAGGRLSRPTIRGVLTANGARIESGTTGTLLSNVQASGRFGGSRLVIDRFGADAGKGGRVTGTGAFDFAARYGIGIDLKLQADKAVMIARDDIGATVTGPLTFQSDGAGGTISGDVVLDRSRYRLGQATAATAAPRLNVREINLPDDGGTEDDAPGVPWKLALKARAPAALFVTGLGLSSEWSADLTIGGEPTNPAITGRANLIRGDYQFAGREFEIERGIIRFGGEVPANPALDIEANADTTGLNASIRVTGNALKPEITFASVPALPPDELLSRLLFGTSITNLSAAEALQLASAVTALQSGGNGLDPINAVRRAAGLDRLRILSADPQTGQGTAVAAGKYITRRFYAEIVSDGQGYSATRVEFQVTRWLSLLSSISTLGRTSGNVRVSKDY